MIPVWLAGDPLVGILTTVGFFMFLMIGRKVQLRKIRMRQS